MLKKLFTSKTILGAAGTAIGLITQWAGVDLDEGQVTEVAQHAIAVASLALTVYGRFKAKGPLL